MAGVLGQSECPFEIKISRNDLIHEMLFFFFWFVVLTLDDYNHELYDLLFIK